MQKRIADIKVRVDPITKNVLAQIADHELVGLSDVVRWALDDFVKKRTAAPVVTSIHAHAQRIGY